MTVNRKDITARVFNNIIEQLAFMFGEAVEKDELPAIDTDFIHALVSFKGEMYGTVELIVPEGMCAEIAANVLGMDPNDATAVERGMDSLKELLNVTCGNLLTEIAGYEPVFEMSAPFANKVGVEGWDLLLKDSDSIALNVDENPVLLKMVIIED